MHKVKSEENVADLGTKAHSKAAIAEQSKTLGYFDMTEEQAEDAQQDVATFWDFG